MLLLNLLLDRDWPIMALHSICPFSNEVISYDDVDIAYHPNLVYFSCHFNIMYSLEPGISLMKYVKVIWLSSKM